MIKRKIEDIIWYVEMRIDFFKLRWMLRRKIRKTSKKVGKMPAIKLDELDVVPWDSPLQ